MARVRVYAPELAQAEEARSRAYQQMWLARRAVMLGQPALARDLFLRAMRGFPPIAREAPARAALTGAATLSASLVPARVHKKLTALALLAQRLVQGRS